jgi:hypothetical protein
MTCASYRRCRPLTTLMQQATEQADRNMALLLEEEEREQAAQRKVRDCSTLTLAELHGTRLVLCPSHTG